MGGARKIKITDAGKPSPGNCVFISRKPVTSSIKNGQSVRINQYLPFAILYFFLNSAGLPFGLTYMTLLSPFLYYWVATKRKQEILWPFLLFVIPYIFIHNFFYETQFKSYLVSLLNLATVYVFCQAVYTFLLYCHDKEKIFRKLLLINFILCLIAIPFYFTSYFDWFWIEQELTKGITGFRRLKMFTYEASYYATLCVPLFFYFFLKIALRQNKTNVWLLLLMISLPFVLSFSLGVISVLILTLVLVFILYAWRLMGRMRVRNMLLMGTVILIPLALVIIYFFPENTLFYRIENVFSGRDTSGKGRTSEAFILAFQLLQQKTELFGIGLGQIKVIGTEIIRDFYLYPMDHTIFAIPNASAETLAIFGITGFAIRMLAEVFFFFYTKVWTNYFRLLLFVFIFIYQFTGSFITNHAEYVIWVMAFADVFKQFDIGRINRKNELIKNGVV